LSEDFRTTRWSLVLDAGRESAPALAELCEAYWYPLYAFARRKGHRADEAEDLTQGFFGKLLEKNWVGGADREKGRFRAYLLTAFKRHIGHEREKARAEKRGGGRVALRLDFDDGERRYSLEPTHEVTAERIFERRWALTLLERVLSSLAEEAAADGKGGLFSALRPHLAGAPAGETFREIAGRLGMSEGAVKTAAHRLRNRYRERLRAEIRDTVSEPAEVEPEIRHLREALGT
jgi:RNA polymerase sigma-70 factor (ECF subfamily)